MWNVFKNIYTFAVGNNRIEVFGFGNGSSALGGSQSDHVIGNQARSHNFRLDQNQVLPPDQGLYI